MKETSLQLAKREMQEFFGHKKMMAGVLAVGTILGIAGPFGTEDVLRIIPRVVYWIFVTGLTFLTGGIVSGLVDRAMRRLTANKWLRHLVKGPVIGCVIAAELLLLNYALFGIGLSDIPYWKAMLLNCVLVSTVVTFTIGILTEPSADKTTCEETETTQANRASDAPALLERLPFDKRAPLISISVQDHYVEITTEKGSELILMRLSDAIKEAGDGHQVHRSHWVARAGIAKIARKGATAMITTKDGRDIPVSRTYVPKLKDAGLLP